jgi:hypothetical protein
MKPQIQSLTGQNGIVIAAHIPPEIFFETITKLSTTPNLKVYVVDTSNQAIFNKIDECIEKNNQKDGSNSNIRHYKIPNCGIGYTYNFGIKKAIADGCDFIILFTDDIIIKNQLTILDIRNFFYQKCNPKTDALTLPRDPQHLMPEMDRAADSGLAFSKELFEKVRFREEFILDQIDFEISKKIHDNGGRIPVYPQIVITTLPIGREIKNGERVLPPWRLYLLVRNSLTMSLESDHKLHAIRHDTLAQISHWGSAGFRSGQRPIQLFTPILLATIDALTKNLGVTVFLQKLSGNRFDKNPNQQRIKLQKTNRNN